MKMRRVSMRMSDVYNRYYMSFRSNISFSTTRKKGSPHTTTTYDDEENNYRYSDLAGMEKAHRVCKSLDMYSFSPVYQYTSYSSYFGAIWSVLGVCLLLMYFGITLKDYILQPPELIKQGTLTLPTEPDQLTTKTPPIAIS